MVYSRESVLKRIEKLKEYRKDLQEFGSATHEQFIKDKRAQYIIERKLFLIAESILDTLDHILSSRHSVISDSYEEIISNAYSRRVIDNSLYEKVKGLGGFRNVLAHEYMAIPSDEVYKNYFKVTNVLAVLCVFLNLLLAARYHETGAAVSLLVTELNIAVAFFWCLSTKGIQLANLNFYRARLLGRVEK